MNEQAKPEVRGTLTSLFSSLVVQGSKLLAGESVSGSLIRRCQILTSSRGEASGIALASAILADFAAADDQTKHDFFVELANQMDPSLDQVKDAAAAYASAPSSAHLSAFLRVAEPPRRELFRRLNHAPGGTEALVKMRAEMFRLFKDREARSRIDLDFDFLFQAWFNRGFLNIQPITWNTSARLLDKIITYEAVHQIPDWEALRQRIQPQDRRCFAFFHPRIPDEPLIFVQVALTDYVPEKIGEILNSQREVLAVDRATTAVFYSISNTQAGLRGVSFGNFLIKQVASDLRAELPHLKTFVTLSPVPGIADWAQGLDLPDELSAHLEALGLSDAKLADEQPGKEAEQTLTQLAAAYFLDAKNAQGQPLDPVARFHLGNGAILDRINWMGDPSAKGLNSALGLMVNYRYDLGRVEINHEQFAESGKVTASGAVEGLARKGRKILSEIAT